MTVKKRLPVFDKVMLFLNVLCAAALLLSYLAPSTDPRDFSFIALLGFGYQVLLLANVLFVLYWIIRVRIFVLLSIISILLGLNVFMHTWGFRSSVPVGDAKQDTNTIRVMQYNVRAFVGFKRYNNRTHHEILQVIREKQPDIIAIEEYLVRKADNIAITDSINRALRSNYHYFKTYSISPKDSFGIVIFSKLPITDSGAVAVPDALQAKAIFVDIQYKNKTFRVYCVHLAAVDINPGDKTKYLNGDLDLNKSSFIKGRLTSAFITRSHQVQYIKRSLEACPYPYIIMGDFNDTPNSYAVNTLGAGLKSAFAEKGSGLGVTYYSKFPKLQIDHILVSPQFEVLNYEAIDEKISDHRPVVSDLSFH